VRYVGSSLEPSPILDADTMPIQLNSRHAKCINSFNFHPMEDGKDLSGLVKCMCTHWCRGFV
jgi:hypothetical protein